MRRFLVLPALAIVVASPFAIRAHEWDRLYVLPCLAALFLAGSALWPLRGRRFAPGTQIVLAMLAFGVAVEMGFRVGGNHRTLYYERAGDLLFTPIPNQSYVEKLSLTLSRVDEYGMRAAPPVPDRESRATILTLGDSITYGIGLADDETYPARLQVELEQRFPDRFEVRNGGVNAYPISLIHQRFLYLWNKGLLPRVVLVGFSMNEGWLGHLLEGDAAQKDAFEKRVWLKNTARSIASYNVLMERWAKLFYDKYRVLLVPGTHSLTVTVPEEDPLYERQLGRLVDDLRARGVQPVFIDFASFNGTTGRFDTTGPLQTRFAKFAALQGIPLLHSDAALGEGLPAGADLGPYFFDPGHMNREGTTRFAARLAAFLEPILAGLPGGARTAAAPAAAP